MGATWGTRARGRDVGARWCDKGADDEGFAGEVNYRGTLELWFAEADPNGKDGSTTLTSARDRAPRGQALGSS